MSHPVKLITTPQILEEEFLRLMKTYENFYWATAWAGIGTNVFKALKENRKKIVRMVVGTHFFQTHPDFIQAFLNENRVGFIEQTDGTFHPKIYLFYNNKNDWELLTGSANFTHGAFSSNAEVSILTSAVDENSANIYQHSISFIDGAWGCAKRFDSEQLENYRSAWRTARARIKNLSGKYFNPEVKSKPIYMTGTGSMDWNKFVEGVKTEKKEDDFFQRRCDTIQQVQQLFKKEKHFSDLDLNERKYIAGLPNKLNVPNPNDAAIFGSMKGNIIFKKRISDNDQYISLALDQIPLEGQIVRTHFDSFIRYFGETIKGNYISTATRLLSMKRPDFFICLDGRNESLLCKDFGIPKSNMTYERYWEDIIERVQVCPWWEYPNPMNNEERIISQARAAFLDSIFYE